MQNLLSKPLFSIGDKFDVTLLQLLLAVLFVIIAIVASHYIAKLITRKVLGRLRLAEDNLVIFKRLIFFILLGIIIITALSFLNVPLTAFAFLSGAVVIGIGFGAKTVMENFISGWVLMSERAVRINDIIEFDNELGTVVEVRNRSTMIRRIDGAHMVIPNSSLLQANLVNWTLIDPNIRSSIKVGVAYGSDVEKVREVLESILKESEEVLDDPEAAVIFEEFSDNALTFEVWFWANVKSIKNLRIIRSDLRFTINKMFKDAGIVIAFPQRDLHFKFDSEEGLPVKLQRPSSQKEES